MLVALLFGGCTSEAVEEPEPEESWTITSIEDSSEWIVPEGYEVLVIGDEFAVLAAAGTPTTIGPGCILVGRIAPDPCATELEAGESRYISAASGSGRPVPGVATVHVEGDGRHSRSTETNVSSRTETRIVGDLEVPVFELYGRDEFLPLATGSWCPVDDATCARQDLSGCEMGDGRIDCVIDSEYVAVSSGLLRHSDLHLLTSPTAGAP